MKQMKHVEVKLHVDVYRVIFPAISLYFLWVAWCTMEKVVHIDFLKFLRSHIVLANKLPWVIFNSELMATCALFYFLCKTSQVQNVCMPYQILSNVGAMGTWAANKHAEYFTVELISISKRWYRFVLSNSVKCTN